MLKKNNNTTTQQNIQLNYLINAYIHQLSLSIYVCRYMFTLKRCGNCGNEWCFVYIFYDFFIFNKCKKMPTTKFE